MNSYHTVAQPGNGHQCDAYTIFRFCQFSVYSCVCYTYSSMQFRHTCEHLCTRFCINMFSFLGGVYLGVESLGHAIIPILEEQQGDSWSCLGSRDNWFSDWRVMLSSAHQMKVYLVWGDTDLGPQGPA